MPKVTLLGPEGKTYSVQHGSNAFVFKSGVCVPNVPPVIALRCGQMKDRKQKDMFKVEDMPTVVSSASTENSVSDQNVVVETRLPFTKLRLFEARA